MKHESVDVSITGNSTNPTRFQHLVAGTYKKWAIENGKNTSRLLPEEEQAARFILTIWLQDLRPTVLPDSMGRMHGDAQFAGSSSVPAHVEMMGLIGAGNNPMVGMTVAVAVAVEEAMK